MNGETTLREMAGELPAVEDEWREVAFRLVDLGLNVVMTEGAAGDTAGTGEKCYRTFYGRRAPCRKCAAAETFRDGAPHSAICERGWGRSRTRFRTETYPVCDAEGRVWGAVERILEETARPKATKHRKETTENAPGTIASRA